MAVDKRAKAFKILISTIRAVIKKFQSRCYISAWLKTCVYIVLMQGEEESLSGQRLSKDHSWRIAEISWVLVAERLKKNFFFKRSNSPYITTCCLMRVSRKILLAHPKTNSSISSCQTWLLLQMRLASMVRWNLKKSFLAANPPDGFGANLMLTVKYTTGSLMLRACFSAEGPGRLVQIHGIMDSIKYQQMKNLNLTASVRNLIMIFHQDNDPNQTSKSTQKCITEHKMKLLPWPSQFPDLNPKVGWTEEKKTWKSEGSGVILDEGMVSDLLSHILQTHQALQVKTQSCYLGKRTL